MPESAIIAQKVIRRLQTQMKRQTVKDTSAGYSWALQQSSFVILSPDLTFDKARFYVM